MNNTYTAEQMDVQIEKLKGMTAREVWSEWASGEGIFDWLPGAFYCPTMVVDSRRFELPKEAVEFIENSNIPDSNGAYTAKEFKEQLYYCDLNEFKELHLLMRKLNEV